MKRAKLKKRQEHIGRIRREAGLKAAATRCRRSLKPEIRREPTPEEVERYTRSVQ